MKHPDEKKKIDQRRDAALRRALNTPPKQNKDYVKGEPQKKKAKPSASILFYSPGCVT